MEFSRAARRSIADWSSRGLETMENSSTFVKVWNLMVDTVQASRSLIARLLFAAHLAIVIGALQAFICVDYVWLLMFLWLLVLLEYIVSLIWEYPFTWLQPCVVVHLLVICPLVWCMEIGLHDPTFFTTTIDAVPNCTNTSSLEIYFTSLIPTRQKTLQFMVRSSEQVLLLVLITSRWILPTRHVRHRSRVSQLLLIQIGRAADMSDIVDLFDVRPAVSVMKRLKSLNRPKQRMLGSIESVTFILMLSLWQASLFQFAIDFTVRKKVKKSRNATFSTFRDVLDYCLQTEIWALALSLIVQEVPFFIIRLYLMFGLQIFEEDIVFFMFNNAFIILLSLYRIYNILEERQKSVVEDALRDATDMFKVNAKQRLFQRFRFKSTRTLRRHATVSSKDSTGSNEHNRSLASTEERKRKSSKSSNTLAVPGAELDFQADDTIIPQYATAQLTVDKHTERRDDRFSKLTLHVPPEIIVENSPDEPNMRRFSLGN